MILTVTLNLAVDVTYHVPRVRWRTGNRVESVARQAGGKGVNVARVLHGLGRHAVITGFAGGAVGAVARAELKRSGLAETTVLVRDESRVTIVIVEESGEVTGFSEPGPQISADEWEAMRARFAELTPSAEAVVLSGSLPPGVPRDAYAQLISIAAEADVPVLLDAEGEALARGVAAAPQVVKINADELAGFAPGVDVFGGAARLREAGAGAVVISEGADGLVALTETGAWRAAPPQALRGNATGAGDAAAAALAAGMVDRSPWPERLAAAAAVSAAAVVAPVAGTFHDQVYRRLGNEIVAREIEIPRRGDS